MVAVGLAVWICGPLRAETLRYHAREAIDGWGANPAGLALRSDELDHVLADLKTSVALEPGNGQAWADLAYAQTIESAFHPRDAQAWGRAAEASARQATVRNSIDPESWERLCVALDIQNRSSEAGSAIVHALTLGPARADAWYFQGLHLAHAPHSKDEALAALGVALRLDPSYTPAHSLRQQLASSPRPASP
jgi:tetratricopeptide (TPR) repeat protein